MLPQKGMPLGECCCHDRAPRPSPRSGRGWELAVSAFSLGVWTFMPKCPLCVAAHVALWTGLGLSLAAATYLRWSLLGFCAVLLCCVVWRRTKRALAGR
jgi:hypothetical protein